MIEGYLRRIGGVGRRRNDGLIEQGGSADNLDPHFDRAGLVSENSSIEIDAVR